MKFNIDFDNGSIKYLNQKLDIDSNGIYVIVGENGVGKSCVIKQIVFNKQFYKEDNNGYITYVEQDPSFFSLSINKYLRRFNNRIDEEYMKYLLGIFELNNLNLSSNINILSGGELSKLNIISRLIKRKKYIFLDEPTNNLDDKSVNTLMKELENISVEHKIIIVSHDPRLNNAKYQRIIFKMGEIIQNNKNLKEDEDYNKKEKYPYARIVIEYFKTPFFILTTLLLFLVLAIFLLANDYVFEKYYSYESLPEQQDVIFTYLVDYEYSELNKTYVDGANILIDELRINNIINNSDLANISSIDDVKKIYFSNDKFICEIEDKYYNNTLIEDKNIISIPDVIMNNYFDSFEFSLDVRVLYEGELPKDNKREVVASRSLLQKYYNSQKNIGDTIDLNGIDYKIVGIGYFDLFYTSFEEINSNIVCVYDENTFSDISEEIISFKEEQDYLNPYSLSHLIIETESHQEKDVLDSIISLYPANNYYSYKFAEIFIYNVNSKMIFTTTFVNILLSIFMAVVMTILAAKQIDLNKNKAQCYDNYYLFKGKTRKIYFLIDIVRCLLVLVYCTIFIFILSENIYMRRIVMLDAFVFLIPIMTIYMMTFFRKKYNL